MNRTFISAALAGLLALAAGSASAYTTYTGFDPGSGNAVDPLLTTPVSSAAEASFLNALTAGVGTETFESYAAGTGAGGAGLTLTFAGSAGATTTAQLVGGGGQVSSVTPGTTNGYGRYSVPSATSSNFWEVTAGSSGDFNVNFNHDVGAFGFYGIDIGDAGGTLSVELLDAVGNVIDTLLVSGQPAPDGSVLFFGLTAGANDQLFRSIRFVTNGVDDAFAFDNFTVADFCQVAANCTSGGGGGGGGDVPEPASLALVATALLGLRLSKRRRG